MKLIKRTVLTHNLTGTRIETPLLLPSFSSKVLKTLNRNSELVHIFKSSSEFIQQSYLISAFDIHEGFLPSVDELPSPEFIFIDSGGYEISDTQDLSSTSYEYPIGDNNWNKSKLKSVYDKWPEEKPAVFVSFDHHKQRISVENQINNAKELFQDCHSQLKLFLLKPETDHQKTLKEAFKHLPACVDKLKVFDVIGVTEKELGPSILDRMIAIAELRSLLYKNDIQSPIHIFGALDPLTVCLYFMAGAEIFDGLTWIRFAYQKQMCVYTHNHGAIEMGIHSLDDVIKARTMTNNYYNLIDLQLKLGEFASNKEFGIFEHCAFLEKSYKTFESKIKHKGIL